MDLFKSKTVELTAKGLLRLNTKFYLKQYEREQKAIELHNSTVSTNFWMRTYTLVLTGAAVLTFIITLSQSCNKHNQTKKEILKNTQQIQTKLDTFQSSRKDKNRDLKALADSFSSNKPTKLKKN